MYEQNALLYVVSLKFKFGKIKIISYEVINDTKLQISMGKNPPLILYLLMWFFLNYTFYEKVVEWLLNMKIEYVWIFGKKISK